MTKFRNCVYICKAFHHEVAGRVVGTVVVDAANRSAAGKAMKAEMEENGVEFRYITVSASTMLIDGAEA